MVFQLANASISKQARRDQLTYHARVVVVVVVATGAERTVGALLGLQATKGAERSAVQVVADVGLAAGFATETLEACLQSETSAAGEKDGRLGLGRGTTIPCSFFASGRLRPTSRLKK